MNHYIKNNAKYSNCELFSEKNIEELRKKHHVTFAVIIEYLNSNTNLTSNNFFNQPLSMSKMRKLLRNLDLLTRITMKQLNSSKKQQKYTRNHKSGLS